MKLEEKEVEESVDMENETVDHDHDSTGEGLRSGRLHARTIIPTTKPNGQYKGLERDFSWLYAFLNYILYEVDPKRKKQKMPGLMPPDGNCDYDKFIKSNNICFEERIIILLATVPHFSPTLLNIIKGVSNNRLDYPELGGVLIGDEKNFWPTVETALFIISFANLDARILNEDYFTKESRLIKNNWIVLEESNRNFPVCYSRLTVTEEFISLLKGAKFRPDYSSFFPASYISTKFDWNDLILSYETKVEVQELKDWLKHGKTILQHPELSKTIKPGYRALFYGPSGTGKTLTAALLGKVYGLDVYRIDLSMLVSKWVGETEKNLKNIFDLAENKDWILFFDEADSIFGKRTQTNSSNDRYANQEIAYLLQRIEDFPGMIILATNLKSNIDDAFNRRFQAIINFPTPDSDLRELLWNNSLPSDFILDDEVSVADIAKKYEFTGGAIVNVVRYCVLKALERGEKKIYEDDILQGIAKENKKKGKIG